MKLDLEGMNIFIHYVKLIDKLFVDCPSSKQKMYKHVRDQLLNYNFDFDDALGNLVSNIVDKDLNNKTNKVKGVINNGKKRT